MPDSLCAGAQRLTVAAIKQRMLNYLQRLYLGLPFNPLHGDSFTSCMTPADVTGDVWTYGCLTGWSINNNNSVLDDLTTVL